MSQHKSKKANYTNAKEEYNKYETLANPGKLILKENVPSTIDMFLTLFLCEHVVTVTRSLVLTMTGRLCRLCASFSKVFIGFA